MKNKKNVTVITVLICMLALLMILSGCGKRANAQSGDELAAGPTPPGISVDPNEDDNTAEAVKDPSEVIHAATFPSEDYFIETTSPPYDDSTPSPTEIRTPVPVTPEPVGPFDYPMTIPPLFDWVQYSYWFQTGDDQMFGVYKDIHLKTGDVMEVMVPQLISAIFISQKSMEWSYTGYDESIISLQKIQPDNNLCGHFKVEALSPGVTTVHIYCYYTPDIDHPDHRMEPAYPHLCIDRYVSIYVE